MNITSNKKINVFKIFKNIGIPNQATVMLGLLSSIALSMVILYAETRFPLIGFIVGTGFLAGLLSIDDSTMFKQWGIMVTIAVLVSELFLFGYYVSNKSNVINITTIVTNEVDEEVISKDEDGTVLESKKIPYKKIIFYNDDTAEAIAYENVIDNENKVKFFTSITGQEDYIEYFPFVVFNKKFRYIRDNK